MNNFRIASLLLDNPSEFPLDDEWLRLLRAEFEAHAADTDYLFQEFYRLLALEQPTATPFKSQHIELLPSGKYRVRVTLNGKRIAQTYDTLDQARLVRNKLLNHSKVGGMMAAAFIASLRDERSTLATA